MNKESLFVLLVVILSLAPSEQNQLLGQVRASGESSAVQPSETQLSQAVMEEEPESHDPAVRAARQARSARYNGGGCDLTMTDDCFFDHSALGGIPLIPLKESAIAFVGWVTKVQPYLSTDRTHIYTETTLTTEEVLESLQSLRLAEDRTVVVDQFGGAMRLRSGRVIRDRTKTDFRGHAYVGGRYVLFAKKVHEGRDFAILQAYELRQGKVFELTEDGSPGKVILSKTRNKPDSLSDEKTFLQAIRQRVLHAR